MTASGVGPGGGDVAVRLGERELRPGVRVELGVAAVAVGRDRDAEAGLLVDADHAGVVGQRERGVAEDVAVVLVGDPRLVAEVRARRAGVSSCGAELVAVVGPAERRQCRRPGARPGMPVGASGRS